MAKYSWNTGFEAGPNNGTPEMVLTGTATVQSTYVRKGTYALRCNPASGASGYAQNPTWDLTNLIWTAIAGLTLRFYVQVLALPTAARLIGRFAEGATNNGFQLRLETDGRVSLLYGGALRGTSGAALAVGSSNRIEVTYRPNVSGTGVVLYINGVQEAAGTTTGSLIYTLQLGAYGTEASAIDIVIDDVAIRTTIALPVSLIGPGECMLMTPNAVGAYTAWAGDYAGVDDVPHTADTDYIQTAALAPESHDLNDIIPAGRTIKGVTCIAVARQTGTGSPTIDLGMRVSTTDYWAPWGSPYLTVSNTAYAMFARFMNAEVLTEANKATAQNMVQLRAAPTTGYVRVTQHLLSVDVDDPIPNAPTGLTPTGTVPTDRPTFAGDYSQGGGGAMAGVQVLVYANDEITLVWDSGDQAVTGTHWVYGSTSLPQLTQGQTYKWKARNKDDSGNWGPYSTFQSVKPNSDPTTPTNLDPTGGETVNTLTPTLTWQHNDPDTDGQKAAQYEIRRNADDVLVAGYPKTNCAAVDTFSRASSPTTLGNEESQPAPKAWVVYAGTWGVSYYGAYVAVAAVGAKAAVDAGVSNGDLYCRMLYGAGTEQGVVFRLGDTSNFWLVKYITGAVYGARLQLVKYIAGVPTIVATSADQNMATAIMYWLRVSLTGDQVSIYLDDVLIIGPITDAALQANTRFGLYADNTALGRWDNFLVKTAASETQNHVASGLSWNVTYKWRVRTSDARSINPAASSGWGPYSPYSVFTSAIAPIVTIDSPTEGGAVSSSPISIAWTYAPGAGAQSAYRVVLYAADGATVLEDTGQQAGANSNYTFTYSFANLTTYKAKVYVWDSSGPPIVGESSLRTFSTSWTPPATITGVTAEPVF